MYGAIKPAFGDHWMVGKIQSNVAAPLSKEEVDYVCAVLNEKHKATPAPVTREEFDTVIRDLRADLDLCARRGEVSILGKKLTQLMLALHNVLRTEVLKWPWQRKSWDDVSYGTPNLHHARENLDRYIELITKKERL